jgi:hypothetical protein
MTSVQFGVFCLAIGRGPATQDTFGSIVIIVLGIALSVAALAPGTRLRGAFAHGKGPSGADWFCRASDYIVDRVGLVNRWAGRPRSLISGPG